MYNRFKSNISFLFRFYSKTLTFLFKEHFHFATGGAIILAIALILCLVTTHFIDPATSALPAKILTIPIWSILVIGFPETPYKPSLFPWKQSSPTIRELFHTFTHKSFLYGLFVFCAHSLFYITGLIWIITETVIDITMNNLFIVMFIFSFLYFLYHIYINPERHSLEEIQHHIDLYATIGTTIGFIMLITAEFRSIKIFYSGLALVFAWLKYIISTEKLIRSSSEAKQTTSISQ